MSIATIAPFVGLKMCLPRQRIVNLLAIAKIAAAINTTIELLRRRRHNDSPEIAALLGSNRTFQIREQSACVAIVVTRIATHRNAVVSKSSAVSP